MMNLIYIIQQIYWELKKAFINYAKFASDVNVGEKVLLDDGKIILEIKSTNKKDYVKSKVIQGGELT